MKKKKHDIDIAMLQEVTNVHRITMKGYQITWAL